MKYDFENMDVDRGALEDAVNNEDAESLDAAFTWIRTPQGWDYWRRQYLVEDPLKIDVLKDMLKQYDEWREKK